MVKRVLKKIEWQRLPDKQLLDLRISDLPLRIRGTPLAERVRRLNLELAGRGLRFRPHVWLSEEWFTPDGVPGFAIPFYLAHPRLMQLERKQMLEVEGATDAACMRIMRHEAGHALDNAFRLHFRRRHQKLFGSFRKRYPNYYMPKPDSRDFVLHLGAWYAQAHPAEDFAETFALWLKPNSRWRRAYRNWPKALRKLEYVDELMDAIAGRRPIVKRRVKVAPLAELNLTLREHYERKREYYVFELPDVYDSDLRRIFSDEGRHTSRPTAVSFLRRLRPELRNAVAEGTGVHHYTIDQLLKNIIDRCKALKLRVVGAERQVKQQMMIMLTVQTMNVLHSGYHRVAL
jgi:hypothetical protein